LAKTTGTSNAVSVRPNPSEHKICQQHKIIVTRQTKRKSKHILNEYKIEYYRWWWWGVSYLGDGKGKKAMLSSTNKTRLEQNTFQLKK
jgi:hypothetical protein